MTEGGISSWKKAEGETFAPGDVLVEIVSFLGEAHAARSGPSADRVAPRRKPTRRPWTSRRRTRAS